MDKSVERFLGAKGKSLEVPNGEELEIDPESKRYRGSAHTLEIRSFEDLQALSLVPQGVHEEAIREAMAADGRAALEVAQRRMGIAADPCDCDDDTTKGRSARRVVRSRMALDYASVRRAHHPNLATTLSEGLATEVAWNSPVAASVYGFLTFLDVHKLISIIAVMYQDIEVGKNSTLTYSSATKYLSAGAIRIHVGGTLKFNSSYVKVRCLSVQGNLP